MRIESVWDFVTQYYPNYSSSDEIAHEGDLHKLVIEEYEDGDCASDLLHSEYGGDIRNPLIEIDHTNAYVAILESAIEGYIAKQNQK